MTGSAGPPDLQSADLRVTSTGRADRRTRRVAFSVLTAFAFLLLAATAYVAVGFVLSAKAPRDQTGMPPGVTWIRSIDRWGNAKDQTVRAPSDVAIAQDGTIWIVSGHDTILGFRPDGSPKKTFRPKNATSIESIAIGEHGDVFVTDSGGQVLEYDPRTGAPLHQWKVESPQGIDVVGDRVAVTTPRGVALFTDDDSAKRIEIGGERGSGVDQFDLPRGIAIARNGTLYVADTQNRRVKALTSEGKAIWALGGAPNRSDAATTDAGVPTASAAAPFMLPTGVTLDGRGRVVVVDPFKFRVVIVDPKTASIARETAAGSDSGRQAVYGERGTGRGFFDYPTGIDYDPTRDWFAVADTANDRVQIVRLPETRSGLLAFTVGALRWPAYLLCIGWVLLLTALIVVLARRGKDRPLTAEETAEIEAEVIMEPGDSDY